MIFTNKCDKAQIRKHSFNSIRRAQLSRNHIFVILLHQGAWGYAINCFTPLARNQMAQHVHMGVLAAIHLCGIHRHTCLRTQHVVLKNGNIQGIGGNSLGTCVIELDTDVYCSGAHIKRTLSCNVHRRGHTKNCVRTRRPIVSVNIQHGRIL